MPTWPEKLRFKEANRYRRSAGRRSAVLRRILAALPDAGDLVVIAHSLGSVVARDLMYHLPAKLHLRLLITIGTPLRLKPMREHLEDPNESVSLRDHGPMDQRNRGR